MGEHACGVARPDPDHGVTLDLAETLAAILARLTVIEQRLDRLDPAPSPTSVGRPLVGQITVDEAIAATNGEATS
jgi:hypothetical protein